MVVVGRSVVRAKKKKNGSARPSISNLCLPLLCLRSPLVRVFPRHRDCRSQTFWVRVGNVSVSRTFPFFRERGSLNSKTKLNAKSKNQYSARDISRPDSQTSKERQLVRFFLWRRAVWGGRIIAHQTDRENGDRGDESEEENGGTGRGAAGAGLGHGLDDGRERDEEKSKVAEGGVELLRSGGRPHEQHHCRRDAPVPSKGRRQGQAPRRGKAR